MSLTVHIAAMADAYHQDNKHIILDAVHYPVVTLTNTVEIIARQLLAAMWAGIVAK
jgi:hypothetical protein